MFSYELVAIQVVFWLIFNYITFVVLQRIMDTPKRGWILFLISLFNAIILVVPRIFLSASELYISALLIFILELKLIFRMRISDITYILSFLFVNILTVRTSVVVATAWINGCTIAHIFSTPSLFKTYAYIIGIAQIIVVLLIFSLISEKVFRNALDAGNHRWYIITWMGICALILYASTDEYLLNANSSSAYFMEICFCICFLAVCYILLFFSSQIHALSKAHTKNKHLTQRLGTQARLQSALMKDSLFTTQANLTKNLIIRGLYLYPEDADTLDENYDDWHKYVQGRIHPDDVETFAKILDRKTMLENFENGIEPKPFVYRRKDGGEEYHWTRLFLRTFLDMETNDVHVFGYGFDIDEEVQERTELKRKVQSDSHTGLLNKATTEMYISEQIESGSGCLFIIDIDLFKNINDTYGHEIGDKMLLLISDTLRNSFRETDIIGRIGGDEFMVYISGVTSPDRVSEKAKALCTNIENAIKSSQYNFPLTVSIGISIADSNLNDFSTAYNQADFALYQVKSAGNNSFAIYSKE